MIEEWRDVKGFEGYYQVSNTGKVKSIGRYVKRNGRPVFRKGRILKPGVDGCGYFEVCLSKNGVHKTTHIHRLAAEAFLPNPNNLPCVNHKDEDKKNNFVCVNDNGFVDPSKSNLEWCTQEYNINFGTARKRAAEKKSKPIIQYDKNGNFINEWVSARLVERELGIRNQNICKCLKGKLKSAGNYVWRYYEENI